MTRTPMWRRYLRFWRSSVSADVDDELRFHLDERVEALLARGWSLDDARRQAQAEFGNVHAVRERLTAIDRRIEQRRTRAAWWENVAQDARYVVRGMARQPLLTLTIVLTMAVGIGAATSMFGLMRHLLFQPPPHVVQPKQVAKLYERAEAPDAPPRARSGWPYPFFERLRAAATGMQLAGYVEDAVPVGEGLGARRVPATFVSAGFWSLMGVRPVLGRFQTDAEAHPTSGARVAVLGYRLWRREYDGDTGVVGRVIRVKGFPYEIIGVAPRAFRGVALADVDLWLPLAAYEEGEPRQSYWHTMAEGGVLEVVGRLTTGAPGQRSRPELTRLWHEFRREWEGRVPHVGIGGAVSVIAAPITGALDDNLQRIPEATVSLWLVGTGSVLLVVACMNVAGVLLLRALQRRREMAVRIALGMSPRRLVGQLITESSMLALAGGVAALFFVVKVGPAAQAVLLPSLTWDVLATTDWRLAGVAALLIIGTAVVGGMVPALHLREADLTGLREGVARGTGRRSRISMTLLVPQCGLSAALLVGAGLFVRSLHALQTADLGLEPERVLLVEGEFAGTVWGLQEIGAFYEQALERVRVLPGVEHASLAFDAPFRAASWGQIRRAAGGEGLGGNDAPVYSHDVTPGFFATNGLRIIEGREFLEHERRDRSSVIVDETIARSLWRGRSPVGDCVYLDGTPRCVTVVGVVENARLFRIRESQARPTYYVPTAIGWGRALLVRPVAEMPSVRRSILTALRALEPGIPFIDITRLDAVLEPEKRPWRLGATVFTACAGVAMLLAAVGLWASIAFATSQRAREFGIRMAVGAHERDVVGLVLRDGLGVGLLGVALGLAAALLMGPWLGGLLYAVSPRDPLVFGFVAFAGIMVALLAGVLPARRAARVDPVHVLRSD